MAVDTDFEQTMNSHSDSQKSGFNYRELARAGYEAYSATTDNKNYRGEEMPKFNELPAPIVKAWTAAATEICITFGAAVLA